MEFDNIRARAVHYHKGVQALASLFNSPHIMVWNSPLRGVPPLGAFML